MTRHTTAALVVLLLLLNATYATHLDTKARDLIGNFNNRPTHWYPNASTYASCRFPFVLRRTRNVFWRALLAKANSDPPDCCYLYGANVAV